MRKCNTDGCHKPIISRGYCSACYSIKRKDGSLPMKTKKLCYVCLEKGEEKIAHCKNLCEKHYAKYMRYGDPLGGKEIITHGMTKTPEYSLFTSIKDRCYNKKDESYQNYGGRGISVYEGWVSNFPAFYDYLKNNIGLKPKNKKLSIDRIDVNGNYEPGNIRWADGFTQAENRRVPKNNKTGCKGVSWCTTFKKYRSEITFKKKTEVLGSFKDLKPAIISRLEAEIRYFGEVKQKHLIYYLNDR